MKPSKFGAMPVDEFDFELMVESYDPEAKNGFIFGWGYDDEHLHEGGALFMRSDNDGIMVKPETICEFTGFITRQGTPVYTNDIVKMDNKIAVVKNAKAAKHRVMAWAAFMSIGLLIKTGLCLQG